MSGIRPQPATSASVEGNNSAPLLQQLEEGLNAPVMVAEPNPQEESDVEPFKPLLPSGDAQGSFEQPRPHVLAHQASNLSNISATSTSSMADKFKLGAKRVIAANRLAANTGLSVLGQPAGVDLRAPPPHLEKIKAPVVIHVMDYDADRIRVADLTNDDLEDFLEKPRPSCSKVRWINVRGISFDVIRVLGLKYKLHPLAVEDIFSHHHRRIKADFYDEHVFISTMMLALEKSEEEQNHSSPPPTRRTSSLMSVLGLNLKDRQRSSKTDAAPLESVSHGGEVAPSNGSAEDLPGSVVNAVDTSARSPSAGFVRQRSPLSQYTTSSSDAITSTTAPAKCDKTTSRRLSLKKVEDEPPMSPTPGTDFSKKLFGTRPYFSKLSPKARKALERPEAIVEQASFFLLKSGVVISIFQKEGSSVTDPIYGRVQRQNTMLRDKSDPSFLLHALVDSVVDHYFPVVNAYADEISFIQNLVLTSPKAIYTKTLFLISKELALLRRTIGPTEHLISSLRRSMKSDAGSGGAGGSGSQSWDPISKLTKTYLGDVGDHVAILMDNIRGMEDESKELVNLIFNTISHSTNESMRSLAVVSLVFLPITFLAGVYGMNFEWFPELHTDIGFLYFWVWCGVMIVFSVLGAWKAGWLRAS